MRRGDAVFDGSAVMFPTPETAHRGKKVSPRNKSASIIVLHAAAAAWAVLTLGLLAVLLLARRG